jgi:D-aspartate ligase
MTMTRISILIPDGESDFAYHVVVCLAKADNVDVHILAKYSRPPARYSRSTSSFHILPPGKDLVDGIANVCSQVPVDLVMPVDVESGYYLAQNRERIPNLFLLESAERIKMVWDKYLLAEYLRANEFPHPLTITDRSQFVEKIAALDFPVLLKPRVSEGGSGIEKCRSREELLERVGGGFFNEFIIQEFVEGEDIDCSVLCRDGVILAHTVQKALYNNSECYRPADAIEFVHHPGVVEKAAELMSALKWNGVAHVDMRIRASDGAILIIEINPRFWGSLEGSLHAGVNFPYVACLASLGREFPMPAYRNSRYMSVFTALQRMSKCKPIVTFFKETNLGSRLKDPLPVIMRLVQSL